MSIQLTDEKITEIITAYELDRNYYLKEVVNNGDEFGVKERRIRSLENMVRLLLQYKTLKEPEPLPEPVSEPEV